MERIDFLIGRILILLVIVAVAVVIAQHFETVVSVLLATLVLLAIARLLWPSKRRG